MDNIITLYAYHGNKAFILFFKKKELIGTVIVTYLSQFIQTR